MPNLKYRRDVEIVAVDYVARMMAMNAGNTEIPAPDGNISTYTKTEIDGFLQKKAEQSTIESLEEITSSLKSLEEITSSLKRTVTVNQAVLGAQCKNLWNAKAISSTTRKGITYSCSNGHFTASGVTTDSITISLYGSASNTSPWVMTDDILISGAVSLSGISFKAKVKYVGLTTFNYPTIDTAGLKLPKGTELYQIYVQQFSARTTVNADIYLMLRYADIEDDTFEPYRQSLQEQIDALAERVSALDGGVNNHAKTEKI